MRGHPVVGALAAIAAGSVFALQMAAIPAAQDAPGKAPYEANCRKCHGVRGIPPKTMKAKYEKLPTFDAAFFDAHSSDSVVKVLTKGKNENMKSFKDKLTPKEMEEVSAYIRSFAAREK